MDAGIADVAVPVVDARTHNILIKASAAAAFADNAAAATLLDVPKTAAAISTTLDGYNSSTAATCTPLPLPTLSSIRLQRFGRG